MVWSYPPREMEGLCFAEPAKCLQFCHYGVVNTEPYNPA